MGFPPLPQSLSGSAWSLSAVLPPCSCCSVPPPCCGIAPAVRLPAASRRKCRLCSPSCSSPRRSSSSACSVAPQSAAPASRGSSRSGWLPRSPDFCQNSRRCRFPFRLRRRKSFPFRKSCKSRRKCCWCSPFCSSPRRSWHQSCFVSFLMAAA